MTITQKIAHTALATLALCSAYANAAGSAFQTSVSDLRLGVIDLTPDDGTAASYDSTLLSSSGALGVLRNSERESIVVTPGGTAVDRSLANEGASASLQTSGSAGEFVLAGSASDASARRLLADGEFQQSYSVTLAANTVFTLSGHLTQQILFEPGTSAGSGRSWLSIDLISREPGASHDVWYRKRLDATAANPIPVLDTDFYLAYANTLDHEVTISLSFSGSGYASVSSVPEPSAYALFVAGLLGIAIRARRAVRAV